jgi:hypothetical protein
MLSSPRARERKSAHAARTLGGGNASVNDAHVDVGRAPGAPAPPEERFREHGPSQRFALLRAAEQQRQRLSARLASTNTRLSWPSSDVSATACGDGSPPADCASAMLSIAASALERRSAHAGADARRRQRLGQRRACRTLGRATGRAPCTYTDPNDESG